MCPYENAGKGVCLRLFRMIGIEIDKQDQFSEQSVPILSQIEGQEIETAHKSVVSPCFAMFRPPMFRPCFPHVSLRRAAGCVIPVVVLDHCPERINGRDIGPILPTYLRYFSFCRSPKKGSQRVVRGGRWGGAAANFRSAFRSADGPAARLSSLGCRLALSPYRKSGVKVGYCHSCQAH